MDEAPRGKEIEIEDVTAIGTGMFYSLQVSAWLDTLVLLRRLNGV